MRSVEFIPVTQFKGAQRGSYNRSTHPYFTLNWTLWEPLIAYFIDTGIFISNPTFRMGFPCDLWQVLLPGS